MVAPERWYPGQLLQALGGSCSRRQQLEGRFWLCAVITRGFFRGPPSRRGDGATAQHGLTGGRAVLPAWPRGFRLGEAGAGA